MNIYVVGEANHYADWLEGELTSFEDADLVIFTGGADVIPTLYNDVVHKMTTYYGYRDAQEVGYFTQAFSLDKKILGICRGAQFLTVMNGGKLIQHVNNHRLRGMHQIEAPDYGEGFVTSTHHQMMYPYNLPEDNYEIIAHTPEPRSSKYEVGKGDLELPDEFVEPEIVYYPKTQAVGIQGHPERMHVNSPSIEMFREILNEKLDL